MSAAEPRLLADAEARERIRAELGRSFCVEAAAGTGKTTLLVQRILHLLESGVRASQLAAITFTELAAAELKSRIRAELGRSDHPAHRRALEEVEAAQISTIHAMALALLKERPVEAGLDPGFETVDPSAAADLFERLWRAWLSEQAGDGSAEGPGAPALRLALRLGLRVADLRAAARALYEQRDVALADTAAGERARRAMEQARACAQATAERLLEGASRLAELVETGCRVPQDRLAEAARQVQALLRSQPPPQSPQSGVAELIGWCRRAAGGDSPLRLNFSRVGLARNWRDPQALDEARRLLQGMAEAVRELERAARSAAAAELSAWLREFVVWAQQEKRQRGLADFLDQLLWCRDLLRDHPQVRRHFQRRFRAVLVDEFQDTDPLQAEIVFFLAEAEPAADDWRQVKLGDGRLFVVGDPKQSIYRFRRADVEMYQEAAALLGAQGRQETIRQNFRSVPAITRAVNALFAPWMAGPRQPGYVPLEAFRPEPPGPDGAGALAPGAYRLEVGGGSEGEGGTETLRRAEARAVAAALAALVGGGRLHVHEGGTWRPATWRDAVVLMPTFTGIEAFEEALQEAGVPFRVVGGRLFYYRPEVRELILLASAVRNPSDGRAVLGALRSGFFGISDAELARFCRHGGRLDAAEVPPPRAADAAPAVAEALERIRSWHRACMGMRPVQALRRILDESGYVAFLRMEPGGSRAAANVDKLLAQAAALEAAGPADFAAFVEWLARRGPGGTAPAEEEDSPLQGEDEDAVRVMTVHKAKGLEFPVVVAANLGAPRADPGPAVVDRRRGRVELRIGSGEARLETPGFAAAAEEERQRLEAERVRLYYVALTRARDYLFVSGARYPGGFWESLEEAAGPEPARALASLPVQQGAAAAGAEPREPAAAEVAASLAPASAGCDGAPDPAREAQEWESRRQALLARAARGLKVVPARQAMPEAGTPIPADPVPGAPPLPGDGAEQGHDATRLGQAFHAVMEQLARRRFTADDGIVSALVQAAAEAMRLEADEAEALAGWVRRALEGPLAERARRARRCMAEVPFYYAPAADEVVEGRMDLLLEEPDGRVVVVDYKTDAAPPERLAETYGAQARAYAEAAARAAPGSEVRVLLYAARPGLLVEAARLAPQPGSAGEGA